MTRTSLDLSLNGLLVLAFETLKAPREVAPRILQTPIAMGPLWLVNVLTAILSAIVSYAGALFLRALVGSEEPVGGGPLMLFALQIGNLLIMLAAVHILGRAFKGTGRFETTLKGITWLQVVMFFLHVLQTLIMLVSPSLGMAFVAVSVVAYLWMLTAFVAVIHGFENLLMVFFGILGAVFGLVFVLVLVAGLLGLPIPGGGNA